MLLKNPAANTSAALDLTNGSTAYAPLPSTSGSTSSPNSPTHYQKDYTSALLTRTLTANSSILSSLPLNQTHPSIPASSRLIPQKSNLSDLATLGAKDPEIAHQVFEALWSELTTTTDKKEGKERPPILMTLDGLIHISHPTTYMTPQMRHIHPYALHLSSHFISHLSGERRIPQGGLILAEHSQTNLPHQRIPTFELAMSQLASVYTAHDPPLASSDIAEQVGRLPGFNPSEPHTHIDTRVLSSLQRVPLSTISTLSKAEARTVLEYYARSGLIRGSVSEGMVTERWAVAGGGNVGELERVSLGRLGAY